ncbi:MAG: hypothetical protein WC375_08805 [Methanomassiliicoccales archaeon]
MGNWEAGEAEEPSQGACSSPVVIGTDGSGEMLEKVLPDCFRPVRSS